MWGLPRARRRAAGTSSTTSTPARSTRERGRRWRRFEKACTYSEFSRIGPRPGEVARCNAAEEKAVALGADAARAALARLDDEQTDATARWRLYDTVARVGDLAFVEPLVRGLEREDEHGLGGERHYERAAIARVLKTLTYADPKGTPAIAWRAWADRHRGTTRAQLFAERVERARGDLTQKDTYEAATAAHFLAMLPATRSEGVAALMEILARKDLPVALRMHVRSLLEKVPTAPAQLAQAKPAA